MAAADPRAYWQSADKHERANGTLFRQVMFALPKELAMQEQTHLADQFAQQLCRAQCLPYSFAVHDLGKHNPHCHLIISERMNDGIARSADTWFRRTNKKNPERGGAVKADIGGNRKEWLEATRTSWEQCANHALENAGHDTRIDCRTLEAQGIDRIPQTKLGPNVLAMEKRTGKKSYQRQEFERLQKLKSERAKKYLVAKKKEAWRNAWAAEKRSRPGTMKIIEATPKKERWTALNDQAAGIIAAAQREITRVFNWLLEQQKQERQRKEQARLAKEHKERQQRRNQEIPERQQKEQQEKEPQQRSKQEGLEQRKKKRPARGRGGFGIGD